MNNLDNKIDLVEGYPASISMSKLNNLAMQVQLDQISIAEANGRDATLIRSEYWLMQLITETAHELQQKGVTITYD